MESFAQSPPTGESAPDTASQSPAAIPMVVSVSGTVTDAVSGKPIEGAYVVIGSGIATDSLGRYYHSVKPGRDYEISVSLVGYEPEVMTFDALHSLTIDFALKPNTTIETLVVSAEAPDRNLSVVHTGLSRLSVGQIIKMPTLLGEADPLKAIQMLPGVQPASEGGAGFSVRGGAPDQNLILLDNATVYNASHLLGFFSIFNNDVIRGLELYKGDIPLRYGGRLSSLLNVDTKTAVPERFGGEGGIGLISSRLMLEGPLGKKTNWLVAGRRSYADLFLGLARDEALRSSSVYFYDANAKLTHRFSQKDAVELNGYFGRDHYGAEGMGFDYGNAAATLGWRHTFDEGMQLRTSLNYSDYTYELMSEIEIYELNWKSSISDFGLRSDMEHDINDHFNFSYGVSSTLHSFNPGVGYITEQHDVDLKRNYAVESALYLSNEQHLLEERLTLRYGVRFDIFNNVGPGTVYHFDKGHNVADSTAYGRGNIYNTYTGWEPRIGAVWRVSERSSIKGSFSRNIQFMQLANNSASGTPLDVWFAAGPNIGPQKVNSWSAGYFRNFRNNMFETSVEFYYKNMDNVIDFKEYADLMMNPHIDGQVRTGTGRAYGMEVMMSKNSGKLTGFVNYTLSRSERTIPEINDGKTYPAPYDKPHVVNVMLSYDFSPSWGASLMWIYASGNPTTYPVGAFVYDSQKFPIYADRNSSRFPDYHRLDVSLTFRPQRSASRRWHGEWNLSLYNVYNKKNPWTISFDKVDSPAGENNSRAEMLYLFGIVPSISYNFKF